jgi:hypothetical protein
MMPSEENIHPLACDGSEITRVSTAVFSDLIILKKARFRYPAKIRVAFSLSRVAREKSAEKHTDVAGLCRSATRRKLPRTAEAWLVCWRNASV